VVGEPAPIPLAAKTYVVPCERRSRCAARCLMASPRRTRASGRGFSTRPPASAKTAGRPGRPPDGPFPPGHPRLQTSRRGGWVLASEAEVAGCLGIALVVVAVIVRVSRWVPACAGTTVRGLAASRLCWDGLSVNPPQSPGESSVSTLEASSAQESGRRPNKYMGRASGLSFANAEDLSEQRGWAPKALASPSEATAAPVAKNMHSPWRMNRCTQAAPDFREEPFYWAVGAVMAARAILPSAARFFSSP
jgi:hypothetical protein